MNDAGVQNVDRAAELRLSAPDGRDLASIRLSSDNNKEIKAVLELWKNAKQMVLVARANHTWDERAIDDRTRLLHLLFEAIHSLTQKNTIPSFKIVPTHILSARAERAARKKARQQAMGEEDEEEKWKDEKDGGRELQAAAAPSAQLQQFYDAVHANQLEQASRQHHNTCKPNRKFLTENFLAAFAIVWLCLFCCAGRDAG